MQLNTALSKLNSLPQSCLSWKKKNVLNCTFEDVVTADRGQSAYDNLPALKAIEKYRDKGQVGGLIWIFLFIHFSDRLKKQTLTHPEMIDKK